jgi:hypothetical protein
MASFPISWDIDPIFYHEYHCIIIIYLIKWMMIVKPFFWCTHKLVYLILSYIYIGSGTFLYNCPSVFRLTCTVLVAVVGYVVNPIFFYYVNFDIVHADFFFLRKFWRCKRHFFFLRKFWRCKRQFLLSYVNFDVVNADFFVLRKFWRCKRHFFLNVHFDAVQKPNSFFLHKFGFCKRHF